MTLLRLAGPLLLLLLSGCAFGQFQSARTTPKGDVAVTLASTFVSNESDAVRGRSLSNVSLALEVRYGVTDAVDVGASTLLLGGATFDAKWNLLPKGDAWALAVRGGVGAAFDWGVLGGPILHAPVSVLASRRVAPWLEPYAGVGYSAFWMFGRTPRVVEPPAKLVARRGTGDGLLRVSAGVSLWEDRSVGVLFEYSLLQPVVDDPGDGFSFVRSHVVAAGLRF